MADSRTMSELLGVVSDGTVHLVRQELRLVQKEAKQSLHELRVEVTRVVPRAVMAIALTIGSAVAATLGLIFVLSAFLLDGRTWLAAFIVAALLGAIGLLMARRLTHHIPQVSRLPRTADSLRETASWIEHPTQYAMSSRAPAGSPSETTPASSSATSR